MRTSFMLRTILSLAASLGAWSSFNGCTHASASEGPHPYYWDFPTSATITHDGGFGAPPNVFTIDPVPYTLNPPLQVSSTIYGVGGNESTAAAGIGRYCDSSLFAATFAQNMSLSQAAPAGGNTPASLKLEFFDGTVVVDGWSNLAGFYNLPLTGDIPLGSSVECILDFTVRANKVMYGGLFEQHFALDWVRTDSGPFSTNLSDLVALPNIPAVDPNVTEVSLTIFGSLEFRVKNDGGPVSMVAPQGLQFQTSPVPEPGTFAMLGILGLCLGGYAWRKRRRVCLDRTMLLFSTVVWFLLLCSASNADIVTSVAGNGYAYGSTGYSYAPDRVVSTGDCELPRASMDVSDSIDYGGVRYARSIAEAYGNTCPANPGLRLRTHATALGGGDAYTFTNANAWGVVQWGDTIRISGVSERPSHLAINLRVVGQLGYTAYSGRQQVDFSVGVANVSGWELDGTSADAWRWANNVSFFPRPGDHIDPLITDTSTFALRRGGYWGAHDQDLLVSLPTTDDFSFTEPFPVDPTGFAGNEEVGSQYHWTQKFLIPYSEDIDAYNLNIFAFSGVAASWDATGGVDSWNTITLESVTFVDGTAVPGAITFDSGFSLPNVPEPGTLSLVGILGVCLGGYAWRKRRQCGKGPSALHDSEITATPYTTGYHI